MRMLFNHGLTTPELFTNTPKKVIDRRWTWFISHYGSSMSYEDAISDPFKYCIGIVMNKIIDEKKRFKIPYANEAYIDFEIVRDDDFESQRQNGRFQEIDFIGSDFTGYGLRYFYKTQYGYQHFRTLYVGGSLKAKFISRINSGIRYYTVEDFTLNDILDEVCKQFKELTKQEVKLLLAHGFRRMHSAIKQGCYITINTTKFINCYIYIGSLSLNPAKQIREYSAKRDRKLRLVERWNKTPFDGYYYIGLTSQRFKEWAESNKSARKIAKFTNIIPRKIMKELYYKDKIMYIFRIKLKKFKGWSFWSDKINSRDLTYMGRVDTLEFTKSDKTWKELIKEYEEK